jgi:N,N'-diacetylchitobiose transport system permease protein
VVLALVVGYPIVKIIILSFEQTSLRSMFTGSGAQFAGFKNFSEVFHDSQFWSSLVRTVIFTVENVVLSMLLGLGVALLMNRVSRWARLTLTTVLLFVWAMPAIVAAQVFEWLFDNQYGVVNYLLNLIPGVHMLGHDWFQNTGEGLYGVVASIVIWGALPFLAITMHAGISQVPRDLAEAARVDGASTWQTFRAVTLPFLGPLLVILTTLSIIWDFNVFNQIWAVRNGGPEQGYWTLGIYMYSEAFGGQNYQLGSAIAIIIMLLLLGMMVFYLRQLFRIGDAD